MSLEWEHGEPQPEKGDFPGASVFNFSPLLRLRGFRWLRRAFPAHDRTFAAVLRGELPPSALWKANDQLYDVADLEIQNESVTRRDDRAWSRLGVWASKPVIVGWSALRYVQGKLGLFEPSPEERQSDERK